jgi:hypothetical protein
MKDIPEVNRMESTGSVKVAVFFRTVTSHREVNGEGEYGVYLSLRKCTGQKYNHVYRANPGILSEEAGIVRSAGQSAMYT